jgi:hypothetical protein
MTMNSDSPQDVASRRFAQLGLPTRLCSLLGFKQKRFAQLGLLMGSLVFSEEDQSDQQPQRLTNLMNWALNHENLPYMSLGKEVYKPRLGVSAQGLALIYYTRLQVEEPPFGHTFEAEKKIVTKVLEHLKIPVTSTSGYIADPEKYKHFDDHIADMAKYVEFLNNEKEAPKPHIDAFTRRKYIWLEPQDIHWWVEAIRETLKDYLLKLRNKKLTLPEVERLGERLECSVFAPLNISQCLPAPGLIGVADIPLEMQKSLSAQAEKVNEAVRRVYGTQREPCYLYLTWDLFAFDYWFDHLKQLHFVYRTVLALWTAWPHYRAWAPPPPDGFSSSSFSLKEATHLLTDLLPALRGYFIEVKEAHHLPSPELTFVSRTLYPPTFYFADPTNHLPTTDKYTKNEEVCHLISNCIGYDDPYAETLSWSTLEGSIATARGETTKLRNHKVRYLLLPIAARPAQDNEIGSDLDHIVKFLTYQEYTTGLFAEDIYKQVEDIVDKRAKDSEVNTMDTITLKLAQLVPMLPKESLESAAKEFVGLQLLLGRVQYALEKKRDEANQIKQWSEFLVKEQMEFQRENMIIAPISKLLCLSAALKDAYPYRSLQGRISDLSAYTAHLANSSKRLGTLSALLSTAISNEVLEEHELQDRQIQKFVALIAIAALLVALPQFFPHVDAQAIFRFFRHEPFFTSHTDIITVAVLALAVLLSLIWICVRTWRHMTAHSKPRLEDIRFSEHVRQYWDRAEYTAYMNEEKKNRKEGKLALMPFLLELCARSWQHFTVHEPKQEDIRFSEHVRQFWELAEYTAYMNEEKKRKEEAKKRGEKDLLPPLSPALHPPPPNWFKEYWNDGKGVESIDSRATWILEGLWHYLDNPLQESSMNKQPPLTDNKQRASEDTLAQVRVLRRLIHVFVLRPDLIPLPRALCILRYKSLQFLDKSTISDNEFLESLTCAGFTPNQVKYLQDWLNKEENKQWIRDNSVDKVAEALREAGITVNHPEAVVNDRQDDLARYSTD